MTCDASNGWLMVVKGELPQYKVLETETIILNIEKRRNERTTNKRICKSGKSLVGELNIASKAINTLMNKL